MKFHNHYHSKKGIKVLQFDPCQQKIDVNVPINVIEPEIVNEIAICFQFSPYKLQESRFVEIYRFTHITLNIEKKIGFVNLKTAGYMIIWKDNILLGIVL